MNVYEVAKAVINGHPLIDMDNSPELGKEYWAICPCGFATKRYKTTKPLMKAFQDHIAEEINEALIENKLLVLNEKEAHSWRGRSFVPIDPVPLAFA